MNPHKQVQAFFIVSTCPWNPCYSDRCYEVMWVTASSINWNNHLLVGTRRDQIFIEFISQSWITRPTHSFTDTRYLRLGNKLGKCIEMLQKIYSLGLQKTSRFQPHSRFPEPLGLWHAVHAIWITKHYPMHTLLTSMMVSKLLVDLAPGMPTSMMHHAEQNYSICFW